MRIENLTHCIKHIEKAALSVAVKYDEPMRNHTTFKIGGPVRAMYFPADSESAIQLFEILHKHDIVPYILGKGSNILADDAPLDCIVINTGKLSSVLLTDTVFIAGCGVQLSKLADLAQRHALTGLEFAHGIPGTLGGAVVMNAGAYGGEMKDVVFSTTAYNPAHGKTIIKGDGHKFTYRGSIFARSNNLILISSLHLKKGNAEEIEQKMLDITKRRRESQPLDKPSAGSTFKRPAKGYAAALIEEAGLKGYAIGGAQVSAKHSGFIVNTGSATFDDVYALIEYIREMVAKRTGIELETEVKIWKS